MTAIFWSVANALATAIGWLSMAFFALVILAFVFCAIRDRIAFRKHAREDLEREVHWHLRIRSAHEQELDEARAEAQRQHPAGSDR